MEELFSSVADQQEEALRARLERTGRAFFFRRPLPDAGPSAGSAGSCDGKAGASPSAIYELPLAR
jgi:hypothetical protein